jgi:hypothetical protein
MMWMLAFLFLLVVVELEEFVPALALVVYLFLVVGMIWLLSLVSKQALSYNGQVLVYIVSIPR